MSSKRYRSAPKRPNSSLQSQTFTFSSREVPLRVSQGTSGTGGLTTVTSSGSYSAANTVNIDPFNIGGRIQEIASLFSLWRVNYLRIRFVPDNTNSGVIDTPAGNTTTPSYGSRTFAWGINQDPALSTLNYSQLIQMGGQFGNTTRPQSLTFQRRLSDTRWFFTSTTAASPTTIDLRMTAPLQLRFAFFNTSTTAVASYGHLIFDVICTFKGILPNSTPLGLSLSNNLSSTSESESKSQDSDDSKAAALVMQNKTKTWALTSPWG